MVIRHIATLFFVLFLFTVAACSGRQNKPDENAPAQTTTAIEETAPLEVGSGSQTASSGLSDDSMVALDPLEDPASDLFVRTIYFDYDSAGLRADALPVVREHGKYLSRSPDRLVRLEGHADERGTREYNLALSEERAKAVREILLLEGALEEQIEIVGWGEERPVAEGSDESALQLNRRVEIVY